MQKFCKRLALLVIVFLSACTANVAKLPSIEKNPLTDSAHGVLVVKIDNFDYLDITRIADDANATPLQYRILKPQRILVASYAKSVYTIAPGTYYISFIAIDSDKGVYYSEAPGLDAQGAIAYGAFTVQPGEVLYLGDIACQWKSTNRVKTLSLQNNISAVKKDLDLAGHGDLAAKIITAKFYPSGSKLPF